MTQTISPRDTGEIQLPGDQTQNLSSYAAELPAQLRSASADAETAVFEMPMWATGAELAVAARLQPGIPRPSVPKPAPPKPPKADMAAAQPLFPLERVAGADETAVVTLLGALGGERRSALYVRPQDRRPMIRGVHRAGLSGAWRRLVLRMVGAR